MIYYCQKGKQNWGSAPSFWREHASKNTQNLKNRASLADKGLYENRPIRADFTVFAGTAFEFNNLKAWRMT